MTISYNARTVTDGLVLNLDAANSRSLSGVNSNLVAFPETFTNAIWSMANGTLTPNATIAPDGTVTGTLLTQSGTPTGYLNIFGNNITSGTTYTFSAYVKAASQSSIYILLYNNQFGAGVSNVYARFDLAAGTATAMGGSPISQTITPASNGWFRISMTATANATTILNAQFLRFTDPNVTSTIYCWGAQIEVGLTATTYYSVNSIGPSTTWRDLSTSGLTATLIGNPTYNSLYSGCLNFTGTQTATVTNPLIQANTLQEWTVCAWVNLDNTSSQNLLNFNNGLYPVYSASGSLLYLNGGVNDYYTYGGTFGLQGWSYATFRFKNSTGIRTIYKNGVSVTTTGPNATSTPSGIPSTLTIGTNLRGSLSKLEIYNRLLTDTEVIQNFNALRGRYGI